MYDDLSQEISSLLDSISKRSIFKGENKPTKNYRTNEKDKNFENLNEENSQIL